MPKGEHNGHIKSAQHYRWNEGRMLSTDGYVKVRVGRNHPLADPNGYAYEHLLIWVSAGNPPPPKGFLLHHSDEDKQHNELGNLELKRRSRHNAEHNAKRFSRRVLTEADVIEMRRRRQAGEELKPIAADYEITFQSVSKIVRGERYKAFGSLLDGVEHKAFPAVRA